jgi:hypothetical protein
MGILAKLIKTVIRAVLLNKAVRGAIIVALVKSVKWTLWPSTRSRIMAFAKRSGFSWPAALSTLAAFLMAMTRGREESPGISRKKQKDQIIDLDEYTIVDGRH